MLASHFLCNTYIFHLKSYVCICSSMNQNNDHLSTQTNMKCSHPNCKMRKFAVNRKK